MAKKVPALERHRKAALVPLHEHAAVLHRKGWAPDEDVTLAQYNTALRAWRKAPVNGIPAAKLKPATPAGGAK